MKTTKVKPFDQFINEGYADDAEKHADLADMKDLATMHAAGLVPSNAVRNKRREIIKRAGGEMKVMNDPILGQAITGDLYAALNSPEWKMMQEKGWKVVSTDRQLFNGSLLITTNLAKYRAMQITATRHIRRVRINVEWKGAPAVIINDLPGSGAQIYINGLKWIDCNIDPKSDDLKSFPKPLRRDPGFGTARYKGSS